MKKLIGALALAIAAVTTVPNASAAPQQRLTDAQFFSRDNGPVYLYQWQHLGNNIYQCIYLRKTTRGNYTITVHSNGACRNSGVWFAPGQRFIPS